MKLSTKIILPLILISALLILLTGCTGTVPDESPGYTPGTISGIIAAPCCDTSAAQVTAPSGVSPEFWCYYCLKTWYLQDGVEVVLTYDGEEVDTTVTNENGQYTFTDVPPGKNYVITAYCPDYTDERPLVKDVAIELTGDASFDAKITDLVSTSLGLVVDFLIDFTILGPEDIVLDEVIADKPEFGNFPRFLDLVEEVRRVLGLCRDVNTDDDLQYALCRAAEEISGLTIGCGPGYTYTPPTVTYTLTMAVNPTEGGTTNPAIGSHSGYTSGTTANISAVANAGYQFVSWTGSTVANPNSASTTILMNGNKSVTANFRLIPTYNVYYDANTGTGTQTDTNDYYEGATVTVKDEGTMAKANYTFSHWDTQADDLGTNYNPADPLTMPASDVTLYAQWTEDTKYNVYYDANGGTGSQTDPSSPYYEGETVTVLDENDMELAGGYTFDGWNTASDGTETDYAPTATFLMPASDVTLYAQWACDPCSGWEAEGVTAVLYYFPGSPGNSDPRIRLDGDITGPACAGVTEIDIDFELYNHGGALKETYSDTLFSLGNTFTVELDIDPASYNAGDKFKLWITVPGCGQILLIEGPIVVE